MRLDVADVASLLRVSQDQVYQRINRDGLPATKVNGKYCFNRSALLEWANFHKDGTSPRIFREQFGRSKQVSLASALRNGDVAYNLMATSKESALRAVVESLSLPSDFDRQSLLQLLIAREHLGLSAMGDGIAIPHPQHPVILPTPGPSLTICFLDQPINYGAADQSMVHTLFVVVCPTIRIHLQILARLGRTLGDEPFRALLQRRGKLDELLSALERVEQACGGADLSVDG